MARKWWFAVSVDVFDSDLGVDLRDRFGPVGLCMWVGFLAACKRNQVPGKIRYATDAECLALMGLPGIELVNEDLDGFTLDEFWAFLGRRKQTKVTRRKRLTDVYATRWEEWQNDVRTQQERERKRRSRAESEQDNTVTESDSDIENYPPTPQTLHVVGGGDL